jgi:ribosome recycling factor
MSVDEILLDAEERMEKAADVLKKNLAGIRTGRANPGLVDSLRVEAYGSPTPLKQLATVGAPEPTQIVIRPYDAGTIKDIEKAIVGSDLGFNPQSDGRVIRINIPPLSTDVRKKMVSRIKELAEEAKVAIRNIRRDGNKAAEQAEKDKTLTEDFRDDAKDSIQELTKKYEAQVTELAKTRESEVMDE